MTAFFRPWRRKIGVCTLVLACVFAAAWVRSLTILDYVRVPTHWLISTYSSSEGTIEVVRTGGIDERVKQITWGSRRTIVKGQGLTQNLMNGRQWIWCGFGFATGDSSTFGGTMHVYHIPYWSITIPLTVISLWLLLSKPRPPNQKKIGDPLPETVSNHA